jgi:glycine cleavage system aminomethyltransferase T
MSNTGYTGAGGFEIYVDKKILKKSGTAYLKQVKNLISNQLD